LIFVTKLICGVRYIITFWFVIICLANTNAQKQASLWFLGNGNGIDFSKTPPEIIENLPINLIQSATISDLDGNLLFYCDYSTVRNASHQIMENGTGLLGSSGNQMVILQKPGSENLYYIFQFQQGDFSINFSKVIYSEVDISANSGLGKVVQKNVVLYSNLHGSFTISGSCEVGYWLVGETNTNIVQGINTDRILAFRIGENGVATNPVISSPVDIGNSSRYRLSPSGEKLFFGYSGNGPSAIAVADFDKNTGVVSNLHELSACCGEGEFSPDGNFLYTIEWTSRELRQYDLTKTGNPFEVIATNSSLWAMRLAPDGKIYSLTGNGNNMGVIKNPNQAGLGCDFVIEEVFQFPNSLNLSRLPDFAANIFFNGPLKPNAGPDAEVCSGKTVQIGGLNSTEQMYEWSPKEYLDNPYSSNPIFLYNNPYDSTVVFTYRISSCESDQVKIRVNPNPHPKIYGSKSVCPGVELVDYRTDHKDGHQYDWQVEGGILMSGLGTDSIKVNWGSSRSDAKVKLVMTNLYNCASDQVIFNVRINVELETEKPSGIETVCLNKLEGNVYQIMPTTGSVYTWEVEGGTLTEGQGTSRVKVDWHGLGNHWIKVHEESVTIDTICFGVSPELVVKVFKDSMTLHLNYVTVNILDETQIHLHGEVGNESNLFFPVAIHRSKDDETQWENIFQGNYSDNFQAYDFELQTDNHIYKYYINSLNGCGEYIISDVHNTIRLQINDNELTGEIKLIWNEYEGWPKGVRHYEVYRKMDLDSDFSLIATIDDTSFIVQDKKSAFVHEFLVRAVPKEGDFHSWSNKVAVEFDHPLLIPNVFTPNGDGVNDVFEIDPIHLYSENELVIYNRWGKEIFRKKNYLGNWGAEDIESGVYYYYFYQKRNEVEYKGWLHILR
jgi:gliding motility-associated-like protein